jgi:FKBP-type peptidyl-prolyl cis-trans isomerase SlyD
MFAKVEDAFNGCKPGNRVQVSMTPEESYGQYQPELVYPDNINNVPAQHRKHGAQVEFQSDQGEKREFRVTQLKTVSSL